MTLAETLRAKLADWRPTGRATWTDAADGWAVRLDADRVETVGCLAWELTLTRTAAPPVGLTLYGWADRIADRATGLLEPLRVWEVDGTRDEAVLRSDGPTVRGAAVLYYEVMLHGLTRATVRRFQGNMTASGREPVAFAVTHEALAKLVADICD